MRIAQGVSYHPFADKVYVHNVYTQKDYILGGIALDVLDCCARRPDCSSQDICVFLMGKYDISDLDKLRKDTEDFLNELKTEEVLVDDDEFSKTLCPSEISSEVETFFSVNHRLFALCLELTYRCASKCVHCYIDDFSPQNAQPELSLVDYYNILGQAKDMECVRILLTGGEVLLRSDLADIAECAVSLGFIVDVYTTGLGLTDNRKYDERDEVNVMTKTVAVKKDKLKGIFDTASLKGTAFKVTITPISEEEADEIEFKSLKGIGSWLNMIEGFFSKMTRQMLTGIRVASKEELTRRIYLYFEEINQTPIPYKWKYQMDDIDLENEDIDSIVYEVVNAKAASFDNKGKRAPIPITRRKNKADTTC